MGKKNQEKTSAAFSTITLENDSGLPLSFQGSLYAQTSFYEEHTNTLTKQDLYITEEGDQAFSIVSSTDEQKQRCAYIVKRTEDTCLMSNGEKTLSLPFDLLMQFTRTLCDLDLEKQREENDCLDIAPGVNE